MVKPDSQPPRKWSQVEPPPPPNPPPNPPKPPSAGSGAAGLVESGLIDSLAVLEIVSYLESTYAIDFTERGIEPEQLLGWMSPAAPGLMA